MKKKIEMDNSPDIFPTKDIYLSSALIVHGFTFIRFETVPNAKGKFLFKNEVGIQGAVDSYFNGQLVGSHKDFVNAWRDLRRLIYENENLSGR